MDEHPRTTAARDNDDHDLIEGAIDEADTAITGSTAAHNIAQDVGSQNDLTRAVADPDALSRPQKADDIHNDQAYPRATANDGGQTG